MIPLTRIRDNKMLGLLLFNVGMVGVEINFFLAFVFHEGFVNSFQLFTMES